MQRLLWQVRPLRRYLTWPALLAIGLLAASVLAYVERVLPAAAQQADLSEANDQMRRAAKDTSVEEKPLSPAAQLAAFYAFFPTSDAQSDVLDRIFAAAAKENLALPQGEYQWARERMGLLVRYDITLPLKGPYPGLRRFMAQVLKETPSLSLDMVSFGRQTVSDIGVDAQVHFTLFLRGDAP